MECLPISIHAPREGSDAGQMGVVQTKIRKISIHAPREGATTAIMFLSLPLTHFNPRSP